MEMYQKIHKPIEVECEFHSNIKEFKINTFINEDRVYKVQRINLSSKMRKGIDQVYMFFVSTSQGSYKLRFDTGTWQWWLEVILSEVYSE
jgi:hypothetical protein